MKKLIFLTVLLLILTGSLFTQGANKYENTKPAVNGTVKIYLETNDKFTPQPKFTPQTKFTAGDNIAFIFKTENNVVINTEGLICELYNLDTGEKYLHKLEGGEKYTNEFYCDGVYNNCRKYFKSAKGEWKILILSSDKRIIGMSHYFVIE